MKRLALIMVLMLASGFGLYAAAIRPQLKQASMAEMEYAIPPALAIYEHQRVIYHIQDGGGWFSRGHKQRIGNMNNHLDALGAGNVELVAVLTGDGVDLLVDARKDRDLAARIDAVKARGVRFLVCRNTLVSRLIGLDALYDFQTDDLISAGFPEIARLESQGYGYIKP